MKELASEVTAPVYDRLCKADREASPDKKMNLNAVRLAFETWIEKVSEIPGKELSELSPGTFVTVDGVNYLASSLLIVKQYHKKGAAEPLFNGHDERNTSRIPVDRLWTPSLFHKLDYDEAREQQLILGGAIRMRVAEAGPTHWVLQDDIEDENWNAQKAARAKKLIFRERRKGLFAAHPSCNTTDALMRKLGAWSA